jgi:hypothetical protein
MKIKALVIPAVLGVALCACATTQLKVPVAGNARLLAGRWEGEFRSMDGRRTGSIRFELRAAQDTAVGEVLLIPAELEKQNLQGRHEPGRVAPELIGIRFVMVRDDLVRGTLEPYRDPVCGCRMHTVFNGTLKGAVIEGTYRSYHVDTRETHDGSWRVRRSATYADARVDSDHAVGKAQ